MSHEVTAEEAVDTVEVHDSDVTSWQVWSPRLALGVFVAYLVAAVPLIVFHLGEYAWFFQDDWDFLTSRSLTSPHDLLLAHNQHWSTIPIIVWKLLWSVFGLSSYRPYQTAVVLCHVTFLALLRVVIRRTGVGPWTATVVLVPLVLFGTGEQSQVMAFQINFLLPAIFGMAHLLLADRDGGWTRRDTLGVGFGLLALMSSGVGVFMVAVVGLYRGRGLSPGVQPVAARSLDVHRVAGRL